MLCAISLLPPAAQAAGLRGSGQVATEKRTVPEFQAIALSGDMELVVRQGAQAVEVSADDNLLPLLEAVVEPGRDGATLQLGWKKGEWGSYDSPQTSSRVRVSVSVPKLSALVTGGSGNTTLEAFNTPALRVAVAGSGNTRLQGLATADLNIAVSGSGHVSGSGSATRLTIRIAGSGDTRLADMQADDVQVSMAGSGNAAVNAGKTLKVSIAGSGDVGYSGQAVVTSSVAGSVRKR
ncbi:MAG: DUF2807 domain-containing protein [Rubrivivax sp.]|nr:DUF2807 domain-containing protein [Rubrivivax sp.]